MKNENYQGVMFTDKEIKAISNMDHLMLGSRLSAEGAKKWNNYTSDNIVQQLIRIDVQELQKDPSYIKAKEKQSNLANVKMAVYDQIV